jgi:protein TonB
VTVYLLIDEKGEVAAVQRTEGHDLLRRAAEEAARHWHFRPTVVNGQPVRITGSLSFNFSP